MSRILLFPLLTLLLAALIPVGACGAETGRYHAFRNIPYVEKGGERQQLDIFVPRLNKRSEVQETQDDLQPSKTGSACPLIVYIHGGGWAGGSKEAIGDRISWLIREGYAVAAINYRLTQTNIFPAQIEDCKAAIRWLRAHAGEYGFDTKQVGVFGDSAGGHLAALVAVTGDVREFDVGEHLDQSSAVQACCDIFGPTDFTVFLQHDGFTEEFRKAVTDLLTGLLGGKLEDKMELARKAGPITYVKKEVPPMLILHGDNDPIVPYQQSILFEEALKKADADVELIIFKGAGHGGPDFSSPETKKKMTDFFAKHLK
ncbi:MAG: alpha/beta hydrolase fold domain-containing protein [Thermoguttaceae bacterium]